tara:strand:- start:42 stop:476 length:435 start_codon:yes stop_codon:yes gene_type:complete
MSKNDAVLLVTFGEVGDGLFSFTICEKQFKLLQGWINKYHIKDIDNLCSFDYFFVAYNITPKQMEKFSDYHNFLEAKQYMIDCCEYNGSYIKHMDNYYQYEKKEIRQTTNEVLKEMDIEKWNPRSVIGKLDFDRRAEEDGIIFD